MNIHFLNEYKTDLFYCFYDIIMVSGIDVKNPKSGRTRDLKPIRAVVTHLKTSFIFDVF